MTVAMRVFALAVLAVSMLAGPSMAAAEKADKKASGAASASAATAPLRMAVVDVQLLLTESKAAKSLQKQLKDKRDALQKEFIKYEEDLRAKEKTLAAEKSKLDDAAFKAKRDAFEKSLLETQNLAQKKKRDLEQAVLDSTEILREELLKIVASISNEKKFDVVINRQNVVIADKALDITDEVLKKLDASLTSVPLKAKG